MSKEFDSVNHSKLPIYIEVYSAIIYVDFEGTKSKHRKMKRGVPFALRSTPATLTW